MGLTSKLEEIFGSGRAVHNALLEISGNYNKERNNKMTMTTNISSSYDYDTCLKELIESDCDVDLVDLIRWIYDEGYCSRSYHDRFYEFVVQECYRADWFLILFSNFFMEHCDENSKLICDMLQHLASEVGHICVRFETGMPNSKLNEKITYVINAIIDHNVSKNSHFINTRTGIDEIYIFACHKYLIKEIKKRLL